MQVRGAKTVRWMPSDGHSPYIGENGNWWQWNDKLQRYVDTGVSAKGVQGMPGQIPFQKEWKAGDTHRNDTNIVDYIYVRSADPNSRKWYKLKDTYVIRTVPSDETEPSADTLSTYYEEIPWMSELAINVLLVEEGNIANFIFKDGKLISVRGTVDGVEADYAGQANFVPNIVLDGKTGKVISKDAEIRGIVYATGGEFDNVIVRGSSRSPFGYQPDSTAIKYIDNVVILSEADGWIHAFNLPWDLAQSGRRITLVNYKWENTISEGTAGLHAPSGKYFFENGVLKTELLTSRECIELLGYGDDTTFYGWIVLSRTDIGSNYKYGRYLKILAEGTVIGNSESASFERYKTFDGTSMSVSRLQQGRYKITFSGNWFSDANNILIMATGLGYSYESSKAPIKATVTERTVSSVTIDTSDDDTRNDGSFMFLISNIADWI